MDQLLPVTTMPKDHLLEWYRQVQIIYPLSGLNQQVFGVVISVLYANSLKK